MDSLIAAYQAHAGAAPRELLDEVHLRSILILTPGDRASMESFSAYNQMVVFDRVFSLYDCIELQLVMYRPLIAMYNTVLSIHLQALEQQNIVSNYFMAEARDLFHLCFSVVWDMIHTNDQTNPNTLLLYLACLCNRGHIQSHLSEHADVATHILCTQRDLEVLLWQEEDTDPRVVSLEERPGFCLNDLTFFLYFRFLPDRMFQTTLAAAA